MPFSMMPLLWEERHDASCSAGRPAGQVCVDNWVGRSSLMTICHDASQLGCYVVSFCPGNSATSIMGDVNFANWFLTWMRRLADKHCGTPEISSSMMAFTISQLKLRLLHLQWQTFHHSDQLWCIVRKKINEFV